MPQFVFRLPARTAGRAVNVYADAGFLRQAGAGTMTVVSDLAASLPAVVSAGTVAGDGTYSVTLPTGDYVAIVPSVSNPFTWHVAPEELVNPSGPEDLSADVLKAAYGSPLPSLLAQRRPPALVPSPGVRTPARIGTSGHGWTGGAADDTAVKLFGELSYRAAPAASATATVASPAFGAQDWSKAIPRLIFRVDDYSKLNFIVVQVTTGAGNVFTSGGLTSFVTTGNGEWATVTIPRGVFTVNAGSPVWTGVTQVQVLVAANGTGSPTFHTHGIDLLPDRAEIYPNGVFILECDDGYASQKNMLLPLAEAIGVPVTMPLIIERITSGQAGITVADLKAIERNGHQLACHAYALAFHDTVGASAAAAEADFIAQQQWYSDNGLTFGALDFALCPGTGSPVAEGAVMDALRRRFRSVRVNSGFYDSATPADPHKLKSLLYAGDTNVLTTHINRSAVPGGAFILAMHEVIAGSTNGTASGLPAPAYSNLKTQLLYAQSKGMAFRTRADYIAGR